MEEIGNRVQRIQGQTSQDSLACVLSQETSELLDLKKRLENDVLEGLELDHAVNRCNYVTDNYVSCFRRERVPTCFFNLLNQGDARGDHLVTFLRQDALPEFDATSESCGLANSSLAWYSVDDVCRGCCQLLAVLGTDLEIICGIRRGMEPDLEWSETQLSVRSHDFDLDIIVFWQILDLQESVIGQDWLCGGEAVTTAAAAALKEKKCNSLSSLDG